MVQGLERNIVDSDYLAAVGIDDLLIQQVADDAQHVFVGMVGGELLVFEENAVEGDGANLVVADGQPSPAAADKIAIDPGWMDEGDNGGVSKDTKLAALQVINPKGRKLGVLRDAAVVPL